MLEKHRCAEVIVEVPARNINRPFDYLIPSHLNQHIQVGSRVIVPFGPRKTQGYVLGIKEVTEGQKLKNIERVLDEIPPLTPEFIDLAKWMSQEYVCLLITALQAMLPAVLKSKTEKVAKTKGDSSEVEYIVTDRITKKWVAMLNPSLSLEELIHFRDEQLSPKAKKQKEILQFFIENYQAHSVQDVLAACETTRSTIQALIDRGCLSLEQVDTYRDPYQHREFEASEPLPLTMEQEQAYTQIIEAVEAEKSTTFLLHGVTGSGKTEVYLQSISYVLEQGKEAIVLVPEISLTPQMVERFKGRFGNQVA